MAEKKDWIEGAVKRPGALRKHFGVKGDETIPKGEMRSETAELKAEQKKLEKEGKKLSPGKRRLLKQLNLARVLSDLRGDK